MGNSRPNRRPNISSNSPSSPAFTSYRAGKTTVSTPTKYHCAAFTSAPCAIGVPSRRSSTNARASVATGNVSPTGVPTPTGSQPVAMAITSDGHYAYVACLGPGSPSVWIYTVAADGTLRPANPSTLTLPAVAGGSHPNPESIAIDPSNRHLYVGDTNQDVIYQFSIDPGTGALTALPTPTIASPVSPTLLSMVGDSTTRSWLYVAARASADVATLSIDPTTGQLAAMKPAAVGLLRGTTIVDDAFSH